MYGGNRLILVRFVWWQQLNLGVVCMVANGYFWFSVYGGINSVWMRYVWWQQVNLGVVCVVAIS